MYVIEPALLLVLSTVIGAVLLGYAFSRKPFSKPIPGILIGGTAGLLGASLFNAPLNFCALEVERTPADYITALLLTVLGFGLAIWLGKWGLTRFLKGERLFPYAEHLPGSFSGRWSGVIAFFFLLPTAVILIAFNYVPMLQTFQYATLLARFGTPKTKFVCLNNFTSLVYDPAYLHSLLLSFIFAAGIVIVGLGLSLLIATMAYQPIKGARIYRSLLIWPYALSPIVVGTIFQLLLNNSAGIINHLLEKSIGIKVPWLLDPTIAPMTIILTAVWNLIGFNILFYIAGLQNVPKDLLEAASIDGANAFQRFFSVTFPLLAPFTFFLVVTNSIYAFFETFGLIRVLTNGGPLGTTSTAMYGVYLLGIEGKDLGRSAAQSIVLLAVVIGITIVQFRVSNKTVTYGA
ncbi:MAG: ABC transporter permease subunit [Anaerolineaceae bacterium]|nr:ABC transporter permease subunit [Anaerolineaceae bacterium]